MNRAAIVKPGSILGMVLCVATLACVTTRAPSHPSKAAAPQPNILFILIDDMGWPDLASYGSFRLVTVMAAWATGTCPVLQASTKSSPAMNNNYFSPIPFDVDVLVIICFSSPLAPVEKGAAARLR